MATRSVWSVRGVGAVAAAVGLVAGCGSASQPSPSSAPAAEASDSAPVSGAQRPTESAAGTDAPSTTAAVADGPIAIEDTLAHLPGGSANGSLLPRVNDPSPIDGTAVPMMPDAVCGSSLESYGEYPPGRLEVMGCEFDSEVAAESYEGAWQAAIADPSPQFNLETAQTEPLDSKPNWIGRVLSVSPRSEYVGPTVRVDLVRQFGSRVYVITSTVSTENPNEAIDPAEALVDEQNALIETLNIVERDGMGRTGESSRIGVRYLGPSWEQLAALGVGRGSMVTENYWVPRRNDDGSIASDSFERSIQSTELDETDSYNYVTSRIAVHPSLAEAQREFILGAAACPLPIELSPDLTHGVSCELDAYSDQSVAISRIGRITIYLKSSAAIGSGAVRVHDLAVEWEAQVADANLPTGADEPAKPVAPQTEGAPVWALTELVRVAESALSASAFDTSALGDGDPGPDSPTGSVTAWRATIEDFNGPSLEWELVRFGSDSKAAKYRKKLSRGSNLVAFDGPEGADRVLGGFDASAGLIVMQDGPWVQRMVSAGRETWGSTIPYADEVEGNDADIGVFSNWAAAYFLVSGLE